MTYERLKNSQHMKTCTFSKYYDVFVDLSESALDPNTVSAHVQRLQIQCGFSHSAGRLNVAFPPGVSVPTDFARHTSDCLPMTAWSRALADATARRQHLVVIIGNMLIGNEAIPPLIDALHIDPLFGSVQPRFSDATTDNIWPLPSAAGLRMSNQKISRVILPLLPETVITAEMLAACLVIRREVVSILEKAVGFSNILAALGQGLYQSRRCGFRNIIVNRVVTSTALAPDKIYPTITPDEGYHLKTLYPDTALAAAENEQHPQRQMEQLLSAAYPNFGTSRRLLIDCRCLGTIHNGTSQCVLGMLSGFAALETSWQIDVLSNSTAAEFHGLATLYPKFNQLNDHIFGCYAAVLMLNQPWGLNNIAELHRHGFLIGFNILDTIAWDVLYPAPEQLTQTWRFISRHSDILTFISQFSQDQFRRRFPTKSSVTESVIHLSLLASEHTLGHIHAEQQDKHILLFGNDYDHKWITPTIRLLAAAFPLQSFVLLGGREPIAPGVQIIPSGNVSQEEVHHLIKTAQAVVYPSFYEGFGLPVIESLAYGRPTLVRRSPLWTEIAAHSRFNGQLIEFKDDSSLVSKLGHVISGQLPVGLPFGTRLTEGAIPRGWRDAAATVLCLFDDRLAHKDTQHWLERDEALRMAGL